MGLANVDVESILGSKMLEIDRFDHGKFYVRPFVEKKSWEKVICIRVHTCKKCGLFLDFEATYKRGVICGRCGTPNGLAETTRGESLL